MLLTIAIICKNEEDNIQRCLDSIFNAVETITDFEVILSDSYSTDRTIEIAQKYPIRILQLRKEWHHSPAAGRYTALNHAKGKYVLYLDADMELEKGFIEKAITFMDKKPHCAAVTGFLENISFINRFNSLPFVGKQKTLGTLKSKPLNNEKKLLSVPGAGLFNRVLVQKVGNFQPFLKSEEEYELCQRLRGAGHTLWYIPVLVARHYGYQQDQFDEFKRRLKGGHIAGIGQMFNWSLKTGFVKENFHRFWQHIMLGGYLWALLLILPASIFNPIFLVTWLILFVVIVLLYAYKKRSFYSGINAFLVKAAIGWYIWRMLPTNIPKTETYPTDIRVLDKQNVE